MGNGNINNVNLITENFNNYFTKVLSKLARDIDTSSVNFDKYVSKCNITLPECPVNINELKDPFFLRKPMKFLDTIKLVLILLNIVFMSYKNLYYIYQRTHHFESTSI